MRALILGLAAASFAVAASAQAPAPPERTYVSSADLAAMIAKAKADATKPGAQTGGPILQLAPYGSNLEYRTGDGAAAVHQRDAELFVVLDGSGEAIIGGKLTNPTQTRPFNLSGTGIEGGTTRKVAKGDVLIVPENTPHQFLHVNGALVMMSMHMPRPASNWP